MCARNGWRAEPIVFVCLAPVWARSHARLPYSADRSCTYLNQASYRCRTRAASVKSKIRIRARAAGVRCLEQGVQTCDCDMGGQSNWRHLMFVGEASVIWRGGRAASMLLKTPCLCACARLQELQHVHCSGEYLIGTRKLRLVQSPSTVCLRRAVTGARLWLPASSVWRQAFWGLARWVYSTNVGPAAAHKLSHF